MSELNYILGQVIARGGMAEVYRGLHVGQDGFRRLVAIKRILPQFSANSEFADMFRDEAHIGQRLQHANVVKVECFSIIDQCPSIVMEFVDGSDLRSILAETERSKAVRRIPIAMALYIVAEAARGLHYAHTRRDDVTGRPLDLVHRDISPQNILVSYNGEVKVTDFGIASADRDFKNTETKAGIVKGKYSYMSPEQISAKKVDARSDVFALSIVLWEILAMRRLFSADNEVEVIELVKNCRISARLQDINPEISADIESLVLRGLTKDPSRRISSMDELERALRSILNKEFPNFTVGDLGNFTKQVLSTKHEASQGEIKKMLTSSNRIESAKNPSGLEIELNSADSLQRKNLTVSRPPVNLSFGQPISKMPEPRPVRAGSPNSQKNMSSFSPKRLQAVDRSQKGLSKAESSKRTLLTVASIVILTFVGVSFKMQQNLARDALTVTLKTVPPTAKVRVNGTALKNGRYLRTPQVIRLERGANILEVSRQGYKSETISIDTAKAEQNNLPVVSLAAKGEFMPVRFVLKGKESVAISVNEGFSTASLTARQGIHEVRDITVNQTVEVLVNPNDKPSFRCRFTATPSGSPSILLTIDPAKGRCALGGEP